MGVTLLRNAGLLVSFFVFLDSWRRHTKAFETKTGQFFATGLSSCMAFWLIWPFEFLKNQIQAENSAFGNTISERVRNILKVHGPLGMYRGLLAGS
jgi:solute carrier family 25 carnitine/acylcarnitine transporter 20/29